MQRIRSRICEFPAKTRPLNLLFCKLQYTFLCGIAMPNRFTPSLAVRLTATLLSAWFACCAVAQPTYRTLGVNSAATQGDSVNSPGAATHQPTCSNGARDWPTCTAPAPIPSSTSTPARSGSSDASNTSPSGSFSSGTTGTPDSSASYFSDGSSSSNAAEATTTGPAVNSPHPSAAPTHSAVEPCWNGANNPPECTDHTTVNNTTAPTMGMCPNGASDFPTCTPPTCANGAGDYPYCTEPKCANGAIDYPTCTPGICLNNAIDYPTCITPGCKNGASDYPLCTPPTCANGAKDYPTCTDPTDAVTTGCEMGHLVSRKGTDRTLVAIEWNYPGCEHTILK